MAPFKYEEITAEFKRAFEIDSPKINSREGYLSTIRWIRSMVSSDGTEIEIEIKEKFEGVRNMNFQNGCRLLEVGVKHKKNAVNFIFDRADAYLIGFLVPSGERKVYFDDKREIEGFEKLEGYSGTYSNKAWKKRKVGPGVMTKALSVLNSRQRDRKILGDAVEVFIVHLAEAARFTVIAERIAKTIREDIYTPAPKRKRADGDGDGDDGKVKFRLRNDIQYEDDVKRVRELENLVDYQSYAILPSYFEEIVKSFRTLSKTWYLYVFSDGEFRDLCPFTANKCHISDITSLKDTLALVLNIDKDSFLEGSKSKVDNVSYTLEMHKKVEERVQQLVDINQGFTSDTDDSSNTCSVLDS